jgi:hypothetical protein
MTPRTVEGSEERPLFSSALDGVECSGSRPGHVTHAKRAPGVHCTGDKAGLDAAEKEIKSSLFRELNNGHSDPNLLLCLLRYPGSYIRYTTT